MATFTTGVADFEVRIVALEDIARTRTKVMLNMANPAAAMRWWRLPADGIGLARMEFIISNIIKIHPMALVTFDELKDAAARREISELTHGFEDKTQYFVDTLAFGIARIAASRYPDPVIVRMSDFKTNEYARLIGGGSSNRRKRIRCSAGVARAATTARAIAEGFALECRAIRKVREEIGLANVVVMIPFCRTLGRSGPDAAGDGGLMVLRRGREWPAGLRDVRDSVERDSRRKIRRALRRLLDRQQRSHPTDARRRPRFRTASALVRRTKRSRYYAHRERYLSPRISIRARSGFADRRRATIRSSRASSSMPESIRSRSAPTASCASSSMWRGRVRANLEGRKCIISRCDAGAGHEG